MINQVTLVGRLAKDPELRYANNGTAICNMIVACDRYNSDADFVKVVVFKNQAESAANYLSKGKMVGIVGGIKTGSYDDKDGKKVYTTEVIANQVKFLSPPDNDVKKSSDRVHPDDPDLTELEDDSEDSLPF